MLTNYSEMQKKIKTIKIITAVRQLWQLNVIIRVIKYFVI